MSTASPSISEFAICIVNYQTPQLVLDCLASFLPDLPSSFCVTIADSKSADGSAQVINNWLKLNDKQRACKLIELPVNGGFSCGYNAAMKARKASNYLLLNSDTLVRPRAIELLLDAAKRHPRAGIFSPRLEWPDATPQESCFRDHSPLGELAAAARTRQMAALLHKHVVAMPVATTEIQPQWTSFAAVLIRDDVLQSAGMLDEGFFLYFEDCEYCYRARLAGWSIVHVPAARIVHLRGGSSEVKSRSAAAQRIPRYYYASRTRYFRLRYGIAGPTLANLCWHLGRLISKSREIISQRQTHVAQAAWKDIWTNWTAPLATRKRDP